MPTYEYRCECCGKTFDYFQSMKDPRLEKCIFEGCEGEVKRLLGRGAGIIFKGSGFYETDYRSDAYKSAQKAESGGGDTAGGSDKGSGGGEGSAPAKDAGGGAKESGSAAPAKTPAPASSP
ncbi:MAG TPA: FmdB family zinc ribbon protein [Verrucomicrobiales bacterium]|nr:FmdB family zinc ribbon protein [Verrucomicrobiales bacterium]